MSTEIDDNIPNSLNSRPVSRRGMKEDRSQNVSENISPEYCK